jgi:hypothetical protein
MFEMMLQAPLTRPQGRIAPPTPVEAQSEMDDFAALYAEVQK